MKKTMAILGTTLIFLLFLTACIQKQAEESQEIGDDVTEEFTDLDSLEEDLDISDLEEFEKEIENFDW